MDNNDHKIHPSDRAYSLLIYSKDCIHLGKLLKAKKAINQAILLMPVHNKKDIDNEFLRLFKDGLE